MLSHHLISTTDIMKHQYIVHMHVSAVVIELILDNKGIRTLEVGGWVMSNIRW